MTPPPAEPRLPRREGLRALDRPDPAARLAGAGAWRPAPLHVQAADLVYFHHDLLRAVGGLAVDAAADACDRLGLPAAEWPFPVATRLPILEAAPAAWGLAPARLYAARKDLWPALFDALRGVSASDPRTGRFWRASFQQFRMVDPTAPGNRGGHARGGPGGVPTIDAWFFGCDGNDGRYLFEPAPTPGEPWPGFPLRIRKDPPGGAAAALGRMILVEESHAPFRVLEPREHDPAVIDAARRLERPR